MRSETLMMKQMVSLRLLPTPEQQRALLDLLHTFNAACSYVVAQAQAAQANTVFALQTLTIDTLLERFRLPMPLALRAVLAAAAARAGRSQRAALFLAFYFFLAAGGLMLPAAPTTPARQVRLLLDVGIVLGSLLGPILLFLILPRFASGTPLDYVYIAYPFADAALVLVAVVQLARGIQPAYRPAFFWLMLGMLCFVYADTSFNVVTLPAYAQGSTATFGIFWVDPLWVAGLYAFCLACLSLLVQGGEHGAWGWLDALAERLGRLRPSRPLAQFFLLAVPVLVLFGLILFSEVFMGEGADKALELLALVVVLLIIVRQLLTMHDLVDARIATERLAQLDALKDQFITSVNHELRTPLMTMVGYIDLLHDPETRATPDKQQEMLARARRAGETLQHLVRSILDTRRIEQDAGDFVPEAVSVPEAAQAALSLMDPREASPAGRRLEMQIPERLLVWGDPMRVQQILTNLLSNALKYSPPEAPVTLTAQIVTEKGARLRGWGGTQRAPRPLVEITVQDRGLGIPPEQKQLLFRRFVRLPREIASNVHGNGLGLYLCRVFAEAMGGTIWVESSGVPGEGSTFYLRLPVPPEQRLSAPPPPVVTGARN